MALHYIDSCCCQAHCAVYCRSCVTINEQIRRQQLIFLFPQAELEGTKPPLDDHLDDDDEDSNSATPQSSRPPSTKPGEENNDGEGLKQFPDGSALNSRLRRLVTSYQREYKKEEARQQAKDKRNERRERIEQVIWDM